jgi:hypothetical protein
MTPVTAALTRPAREATVLRAPANIVFILSRITIFPETTVAERALSFTAKARVIVLRSGVCQPCPREIEKIGRGGLAASRFLPGPGHAQALGLRADGDGVFILTQTIGGFCHEPSKVV